MLCIILAILCKVILMEINVDKLCLILPKTPNDIASEISGTLAYPNKDLHLGFKYLGFYLKPNNHRYMDYIWILKKVESRISLWFNNFLSQGRRIMLVSIFVSMRRIAVIWRSSSREMDSYNHPKNHGGWGLKNIFLFTQSLPAHIVAVSMSHVEVQLQYASNISNIIKKFEWFLIPAHKRLRPPFRCWEIISTLIE